jgi:hypothetical protein
MRLGCLLRRGFRLRVFSNWEPGGWVVAAVCLLAGVAGAFAVDWLSRSRSVGPSLAAPNSAHLMESMAAQSHSATGTLPRDWASRLTRKLPKGTAAPDFTLPAVRGPEDIALSGFRGKPVVLVFGSFSCDVFCDRVGELERLYRVHKERAVFLFVNVTEAGHRIPGLEYMLDGVKPGAGQSLEARRPRIERALKQLRLTMPAVVDAAGAAEAAYDAYPLRLVGVDARGAIGLDLGRGVFEPWELRKVEEWLKAQAQGHRSGRRK